MRGSFTFAAAMVWEREVASKYLLAISTSGSSGILTGWHIVKSSDLELSIK
jgi:hypothetical protein